MDHRTVDIQRFDDGKNPPYLPEGRSAWSLHKEFPEGLVGFECVEKSQSARHGGADTRRADAQNGQDFEGAGIPKNSSLRRYGWFGRPFLGVEVGR